jgi:transposase, IS30 family
MGHYYRQLTQEQRYTVSILKRMTCTQTHIADMVCVDKSTITRELKRNRGNRGYRPQQAHQRALTNRQRQETH